MEQKTKWNLRIGGSIALTAVLALSLGLVIGWGVTSNNSSMNDVTSNNEKGIGAFSNLGSFTEDGFNNGVLTAAQNYINTYDGNDTYSNAYPDRAKLDEKTSSYSDDGHEYVDMLSEYYNENDIIISAGFQVAGALTGSADTFDGVFTDKNGKNTDYVNSKSKAFVLLDDSSLPTLYDNVASISYAAEGAGYLSGYAAAVYTEWDWYTNKEKNGVPNIIMWGGNPFSTVYDFMSGFAQAITEINTNYEGHTLASGEPFKKITLWSGDTVSGKGISDENTYGTSTGNENTWYSFGFDSSEATNDGAIAKIKTQNALSNNTSIVFPVAGGNSTVAETVLMGADSTTTKIVGVDSDATLASSNDDLYIGTAQKNLVTGGQLGLWAMDDFDGDGVRNSDDGLNEEDTFGQNVLIGDDGVSDSNDLYNSWFASDITTNGVQFRGDIANGGVGFQFGSNVSAGMNEELKNAIVYVLGGELENAENKLTDFLKTNTPEDSNDIESANPEFIPEGW